MPAGPFDYNASGAFGGVTGGYNWQSGNVVYGFEGDVGYLSSQGSGIIGSQHADSHQDLTPDGGAYGDLTGRLGLLLDNTLFYGKGGVALFSGKATQATTKSGYTPTGTGTFGGFAIGAGIEQALSPALSIKAEYMHFRFGPADGFPTATVADLPTPAGFEFHNSTTIDYDTVKVGLNYHF